MAAFQASLGSYVCLSGFSPGSRAYDSDIVSREPSSGVIMTDSRQRMCEYCATRQERMNNAKQEAEVAETAETKQNGAEETQRAKYKIKTGMFAMDVVEDGKRSNEETKLLENRDAYWAALKSSIQTSRALRTELSGRIFLTPED
ncbi:MAG: hypothetical protein MMC33_006246 [Icmadophila ericetorum]|nr:hypothetical protein [Icmadophila ericetorum]